MLLICYAGYLILSFHAATKGNQPRLHSESVRFVLRWFLVCSRFYFGAALFVLGVIKLSQLIYFLYFYLTGDFRVDVATRQLGIEGQVVALFSGVFSLFVARIALSPRRSEKSPWVKTNRTAA